MKKEGARVQTNQNQKETTKQPFKGDPPHRPVLLSEVLSAAEEISPKSVLDCTFGRGGHSKALLSQFPKLHILALDWDGEAIKYGQTLHSTSRIQFLRTSFYQFPEELRQSPPLFAKQRPFDMILMDLGVSSPQLDQGERGFSFYRKGPLDMRMDRRMRLKAEDLVNGLSKRELIQLFQEYGEVKRPFPVVHAIFEARKRKRIQTTEELVQLIQKQAPRSRFGRHPATPYFLALRMKVNGELEGLKKSLPDFLPFLKGKGYFVVISFHSLEDRIVKQTFRRFVKEEKGFLWNKKAMTPSSEEKKVNLRSRSARLRVFVKKQLSLKTGKKP